MSKPKLDPETVAALYDGRLPPAERVAVLRMLEESDADRDILAEVSALQEEMQLVAPTPPARQRAQPVRWLPWALAAAVMLAVIRIGVQHNAAITPLPDDWNGTPWSAFRGDSDAASDAARAIRIGARLEDLVRATDPADFEAVRNDLLSLLADQPGAGPAESLLRAAMPASSATAIDAITALFPASEVQRGRQLETMRLRLASDSSSKAAASARMLLQLPAAAATPGDLRSLRALLDSTLAREAQ